MATFASSPAPRRTVARHTPTRQSPPVRRKRASQTPGPSRFATPHVVRQQDRLSSIRDDESERLEMDVDEENEIRGLKPETIFAKSPELTATFYSHLPVEVKQVLKSADFFRDAYTGTVDAETGYAVVSSQETCFVWKYAQALTGTPTCYIFLCPTSGTSDPMDTPFHALVPHGSSREPGLIIISPRGQIRFWDGLGMGLAGGDNFAHFVLPMEDGETVTTLTRTDPHTYIASTSFGKLWRLTLTASGGGHNLTFHRFGRPQSGLSLTRIIPGLWSAPKLVPQPGYANSVALGKRTTAGMAQDIWAVVDLRIQKWNMSFEGWEELLLEEEISDITCSAIRKAFPTAPVDDAELNLELLDMKLNSSEDLVVLISYAGEEDLTTMDIGNNPRRIYAIVRLQRTEDGFRVQTVRAVPYQSISISGAPMHPRLQRILNGEVYAIQFGDAVTICAIDAEYMDRLMLKSATDRTLGIGVIDGESELLVLTAATLMKAFINMDRVARFDPQTGRADLIKSTMTQAILYGSHPENPLHFSFPPEIDADALMSGAEQLSQAVLESDFEIVRPHHDLQTQMINRKERLQFLIRFINENGVLTKMSQRSRQTLATNDEKLYAARQLWSRHSELMGADHQRPVLYDAIYAYLEATGEGYHEDFVRAFFRLKIRDLGGLLPHVVEIVRQASHEHTPSLSDDIWQANEIVLTILQSALDHRDLNKGVYGLEYPLVDPWTSLLTTCNIVAELFGTTEKLVESTTADPDAVEAQSKPRSQLPELATLLFTCIQEHLDWLKSPLAHDIVPEADQREQDVEDKFRQLRPNILETLRRNGFASDAFQLAEKYRDFRSLASLCNKDTVYPPQDNPNAARIQSYADKFKQDFTTELYRWYIEHGELRTLFAQEHDQYLDEFFVEHPQPDISWIHDLGQARYGPASDALLNVASHASELEVKHLVLSIGKLSQLAQLHEENGVVNQSVLDAFHDGLDFVSVHETLRESLKTALASLRGKQPLETQIETITQAKVSKLLDREALQNVFRQLVRQLLQGKALSPEDIAEVLSLKENRSSPEDFATALQILARAQNIPDVRKVSAFRTVWRRIYIQDDWENIRQTVNMSDAELNEHLRATALYAALQATMFAPHAPTGYVSSPAEAHEVPDPAELALRWPGMSPDDVDAVYGDCQKEREYLAELGLEGMYQSMRELVAEDAGAV
ncbi:hypothetical protein DAEQUDRAFT_709105 [Daedalea quercina L-15889]|uniref:Nucleoporin Nup133/Nup155-like C-terminal domain-containing protein n=1 Tax=Daedalea quercina L-15889 TaxID=1314783 RepID=A0A165R1A5_9APHY|nr:hypothetical protein DAEQUDRAFT_709105 [Daedalea quercina L-15889]